MWQHRAPPFPLWCLEAPARAPLPSPSPMADSTRRRDSTDTRPAAARDRPEGHVPRSRIQHLQVLGCPPRP